MRFISACSARVTAVSSWTAMALAIVIVTAAPLAPAMAAHKRHPHPPNRVFVQPPPSGPFFDPTGGNAAAGGNNANSMSGSNSANENANGRSSGGFGGM